MPDPSDSARLRELLESADLGELYYQEEADAYTHIVRKGAREFVVQFSQDTSGKAEARARLFASLSSLPALLDEIDSRAWQDIATAPKDGTWLLAWGGGCDVVMAMRWCDRVGAWESDGLMLEDWDNQAEGYSRPTHWMPLPNPPALTNGDQP